MRQNSPIDQDSLSVVIVLSAMVAIISQSWLLTGLVAVSLLAMTVNSNIAT